MRDAREQRSAGGRRSGSSKGQGGAVGKRSRAGQARRRRRKPGVIHVGMREESRSEVDALRRGARRDGGVHAVEAHASRGEVELGGEAYDLATEDGLHEFTHACIDAGMSAGQAARLAELVAEHPPVSRDEIAKLGLAFFRVGSGELEASRLVLSGHSVGLGVFGEDGGKIRFEAVGELARVFPDGAAEIQHVALAACNSGHYQQVETVRAMFPNLESYLGYAGYSPKAEQGAPRHLSRWEARTDGDDPKRVDPLPGSGMSTWNQADGFQGPTAGSTVEELEAELASRRPAWEPYAAGERTPEPGRRDRALDEYFVALARLLYHPRVSEERRAELEAHRDEVFEVRRQMHP